MVRTLFLKISCVLSVFTTTACNITHTKIGSDYYPGIVVSQKNSLLTTASKEVVAEESIIIELNLRDQNFTPFISTLPKVGFYTQGGSSSGRMGAVTNQGGGRYTAAFAGVVSGTATTLHSTVDGVEISSNLPEIKVVVGPYSKSKSIVTLSSSTVLAGSSVTATLSVKDTNGNLLTQGGLNVLFSNSLGTAVGAWGAVNDLGNGTYTAIFTATLGGSTTQVTATIEGNPLTSAAASLAIDLNPPSVPGSLITVSGLGTVDISWNPSSSFASVTYTISRSATSGNGYGVLATGTSALHFTDSTPSGSTLYYYVVQAQSSGGTSAYSGEVSAHGLVSFSQLWTLNSSNAANFTLGANVDLTSSTCELTPAPQTDNANISLGFAGGVANGVIYGTLADGSSQGLKLGNSGSCDGTTANCVESNLVTTPKSLFVVGMWHLNELLGSTTVADSSLSAKPGTAVGAVTLGENGKVGFSPILDGSSAYFKMGAAGLDGYSEISISAWVKMNGLPGSKYFVAGKEGVYKIDILSNGTTRFLTGNNWGGSILYSTSPISPGAWIHLVATYDGTTKYLYINGVRDANTVTTFGSLNVNGSNDASIGAYGLGGSFGNFFNGQIDEVIFWNKALTGTEVKTLYDNQSSNVLGSGGIFTSRVMDAYQGSQSWTSLSWIPTLPFYKALTESAASESTVQYSSLVNSSLMAGNVGLWHLDESIGTSGANSVIDGSGQASHGIPTNTNFGKSGKFNTSVGFNGTGYISNQVNSGLTNQTVTVSAWFRTTSSTQGEILSMGNAYFIRTNNGSVGNVGFRYYNGSSYPLISAGVSNSTDGAWHHVVGIKSPSEFSVYYDGVLKNTLADGAAITFFPATNFIIGRHGFNSTNFYTGSIDEVSVWNRALNANEIKQIYQRGASRLKFQVRSCSDNACSSGASIWKGPDGTTNSYFSELFNLSTQGATPSGSINLTTPSISLQSYASPISNNRYFQYRAILDSDVNLPSLMPEIKAIAVGPTHYDTAVETVISQVGTNYVSLTNAIEGLGSNNCSSGVLYNLGVGSAYTSATWYYWNGSGWATSLGTIPTANNVSTILGHLGTFAGIAGSGTVYFKAYLQSTGISPCELNSFQLNGTR